ncbi:uncharacterized protein E0L32_009637 [Thyridium curvatum]|uniref:Lysine-specific histone demethylase 1 n=1 Tax=Thyridium curvatum TaxID=1093900 RepID=A0A507AMM3_9PEZI|nr:uncharacterized protein E0L32_009637 [Thyridium curvatum]TPX08933.1 hypothetical protein E0L32_009637 [Thyridium curvatum]
MRSSLRDRPGKDSGLGKRLLKPTHRTKSHPSKILPSAINASLAKPLSPATSISDISPTPESFHSSWADNTEEIVPEIIVCTDDMDIIDMDSSPEPEPAETLQEPAHNATDEKPPVVEKPAVEEPMVEESTVEEPVVEKPAVKEPVVETLPAAEPILETPQLSAVVGEAGTSLDSSLSVLTEQSELSSIPSTKATTPVDVDSSKDNGAPSTPQPIPAPVPVSVVEKRPVARRRFNVRPRVSIPVDLTPQDYAIQCVAAAESSRLNPYALHNEEYTLLRNHISHAQVTTYLNIRNGILRLWISNPQMSVRREEAVGCARDVRWFDVASVCYDWLVRRGYINFGCVEVRQSRKKPSKEGPLKRRKRIAVIGAGMSGLGCARQLEGLFKQYSRRLSELGEEPPEVIVLEGRNRVGGRVYSRAFQAKPEKPAPGFEDKRCTAEMGGMIITGFDRGNPMDILVRGQLHLGYHALLPETTIYDSNGKPVDSVRDLAVEKLYNDCLDRVSEYKFKAAPSKVIEGNRDLMDEGKDSSAEVVKSISYVEETTAAQPYAPSVAQQNVSSPVSLVPVSSDRVTGRMHMEPGTPGSLKAAYKAKLMGWALKAGASEDKDLDLEFSTKAPNATLGSVVDDAIMQYKDVVDLNSQDFRLMNWHIANLEYSNAIDYSQLSLQGWDIDAGNEWEGKHTMVVGGYQTVPRGLALLPSPLKIRQRSPVKKIKYSTDSSHQATVECEDGFAVEADYVVNTIPLGVLKHGNVEFDPPLPTWKSDVVNRLGFGVLNKLVLVYKEAFWDEDRDIFGVLRNPKNRSSLNQRDYASQRGRMFQWFNVTHTTGMPCLIALMAGEAGFDTEQSCNDDLLNEATDVLRSVFGARVPAPLEFVVTRWTSDKFARGSYSSAGPDMKADDYDVMARPIGNLHFAGEHTIGTHPATVHGAYMSGLRAASDVLEAMLGPIEVPEPLIRPRESASLSSLKRKASEDADRKDPRQARLEAYEAEVWQHIHARLGDRPLKPPKLAGNAYLLFNKANFDAARRRCEEGRRPGKGKPVPNEVRVMTSKMWREAGPEERAPYERQAEEQKRSYAEAVAAFGAAAAEWDARALEVRAEYERERPSVPGPEEVAALASAAVAGAADADRGGRRRTKAAVGSYAESDSDVEMEEA